MQNAFFSVKIKRWAMYNLQTIDFPIWRHLLHVCVILEITSSHLEEDCKELK